jgi:hypothetical protein
MFQNGIYTRILVFGVGLRYAVLALAYFLLYASGDLVLFCGVLSVNIVVTFSIFAFYYAKLFRIALRDSSGQSKKKRW